MILEEATYNAFGYYTKDLTPQSGKPIIAACELCGEFRITNKRDYRTFCKSCIRTSKNNSMYGRNHTDKAKALMSAANIGKHRSEESRSKQSASIKGEKNHNFGKHLSEEQKAKQSAAMKGENNPNYGVPRSEDHKAKISAALKGRIFTEEHKANIRAAHNGKKCSEETKANISAALKGEKNHNFGKHFTDERKALMSAAMNGEKHPNFGKRCEECGNYKGGKKAADARQHAKRKRQLGYTLLMPLVDGEVGHHVTNEFVIGIPAEVHNSIGGRRKRHRALVLQWLKANDEKKYLKVLCVLAKEPLQKSA